MSGYLWTRGLILRWAEQSFNRRLSWSFATVKSLSHSSSCRQGSASKAGSFFVKLRETAVSEVTVGKTANESAPFSLLKCLTYDTCGCFWKFRDATLTKKYHHDPSVALWKHSITNGLTFNYLIRSTDSGACHICGELGHKRRDCPTRLSELPKKRYHRF